MAMPRSSPSRSSGSVLSIVLVFTAGATTLGALFYGFVTTAESHRSTAVVRRNPTAADARFWLVRAGLDPKALAAAGFTDTQVTQLVTNTVDFLAGNVIAMEETDHAIRTAKESIARLEKTIMGGMARTGDTQALTSARTTLQSQEQLLDEHLAGLRAAGIGQLPVNNAAASLGALLRNRSKAASLEFAAEDRTQAEWIALRDALSARRVNQQMGRDVPGSVTAIIARASTPAVSTAATRLNQVNVGRVTAAWDRAINALGGG
jgi:hypothetical protein